MARVCGAAERDGCAGGVNLSVRGSRLKEIIMEYKMRVLELKNKKILIIQMENEKFQKVATLLQSDVVADFEWYKKSLYSVLNGKQKKILGVGNLCEIEITPEYTYIYDAVTEDKECCKTKTDELYNTILNWEKDYKSFLENIDRIEPHRLS